MNFPFDTITIVLSRGEADQLLQLLNRALNTLEPIAWPPVAQQLLDKLGDVNGGK